MQNQLCENSCSATPLPYLGGSVEILLQPLKHPVNNPVLPREYTSCEIYVLCFPVLQRNKVSQGAAGGAV